MAALVRQAGPYRVLTPEGEQEARDAILVMDPAALSYIWPAVVVLKNRIGWAWRVFQDDKSLVDSVLKSIGPGDKWALLKGPSGVHAKLLEAEQAEAARQEAEAKAKREAEQAEASKRLKLTVLCSALAVGSIATISWVVGKNRAHAITDGMQKWSKK